MKRINIVKLIKLIIFISFSITIFFIRNHFVENLKYYVPSVMIIYGIFEIVFCMFIEREPCYKDNSFYWGLIEILLGTIILLFVSDYVTVCVSWAIWSILREALEIEEIVSGLMGKIPVPLSVISMIESIAVIILSTIMIVHPNSHHALVHSYLLSVELILAATIPLFKKELENNN